MIRIPSNPNGRSTGRNMSFSSLTRHPSALRSTCSRCSRTRRGDIHMGHVRNYTIGDVLRALPAHARLRRAASHRMGRLWPAGRKRRHQAPSAIRPRGPIENIDTQKASFKRMGLSYDWDRTVVACDPDYYRWGQWIFLKMYESAAWHIASRNSPVNWCPDCKTVLANEQVEQGTCWRCHSAVEKPRARPSGTSRSPITPRSCLMTSTS